MAKLLYDHGWRWDDLGRYSRPARPPRPACAPPGRPYGGPGHGPSLSAGSVVVVDEAGLLSVDQAVALIDVVRGSGASLRLVGDPRQLGAVGRGGVMETAARWAPAGEVTLSQVHRFLRLEAGPDGLPVTVPDRAGRRCASSCGRGLSPSGRPRRFWSGGQWWCTRAGKRRWPPWRPRQPGRRAGRGRWR